MTIKTVEDTIKKLTDDWSRSGYFDLATNSPDLFLADLKASYTTLIEAAVKEVENMKVVTHGDYHDHHLGHILNKRIDQVITALRELGKVETV